MLLPTSYFSEPNATHVYAHLTGDLLCFSYEQVLPQFKVDYVIIFRRDRYQLLPSCKNGVQTVFRRYLVVLTTAVMYFKMV